MGNMKSFGSWEEDFWLIPFLSTRPPCFSLCGIFFDFWEEACLFVCLSVCLSESRLCGLYYCRAQGWVILVSSPGVGMDICRYCLLSLVSSLLLLLFFSCTNFMIDAILLL
jgi:hypothetical protein